jgi:hypothetical protein
MLLLFTSCHYNHEIGEYEMGEMGPEYLFEAKPERKRLF